MEMSGAIILESENKSRIWNERGHVFLQRGCTKRQQLGSQVHFPSTRSACLYVKEHQ